jgi:REP element-mobilizing transposase RayT
MSEGVRAYHSIFCAYGFWLPNDPRGSWSDYVAAWELFRFGPATKTDTRRSVAHAPHDVGARGDAKESLRYPPVVFDGHQALAIAHGFARMIGKAGYTVHACSILPEHVHLVTARFRYKVEHVVRLLKAEASTELEATGQHPLAAHRQPDDTLPSPWARKGWNVFLNTDEDIRRAVTYVENNPAKEGKRPQRWSFVTPFKPAEAERRSANGG